MSCKHKAHSGSSVTPQDEVNIRDRIEANQCEGFIGFYSTLPSSGLSDVVKGLSAKAETQILDREKIESYLLKSPEGLQLAKRYFPKSASAWIAEHQGPAKVFDTHPTLSCKNCNKNLLVPEPSGIIVIWRKTDSVSGRTHHESVYWCCKGNCDQALSSSMRGKDYIDGWEDIPDVTIPLVFVRWMITPLNELNRGDTYSPEAFDNLKEFILSVYPYVARNATQEELERIDMLRQIPSYLGGLGY